MHTLLYPIHNKPNHCRKEIQISLLHSLVRLFDLYFLNVFYIHLIYSFSTFSPDAANWLVHQIANSFQTLSLQSPKTRSHPSVVTHLNICCVLLARILPATLEEKMTSYVLSEKSQLKRVELLSFIFNHMVKWKH